MKYEVNYFKGLSQIEGLEKLLEISFLKEALLRCVLKNEGSSWFRVENQDGNCLTLSNEKYLVILLIEVNEFIINEIKEAIPNIDKYIPIVVKLEIDTYNYDFPREVDLKVDDICETAKRDGIGHKNLFLIFLRILFDKKPY
ncbi:hypothetical protein APR41_05245 [Salegentibacter salinarum]|uniref:Uncharacterized protein n=1 Tax=Salegentibacter salinarum TaxID=447422 RepID=A0A2N0TS99_9FLAO|nr:hypothetical protein [Salegentibacter salinarum]PKD17617.1 hypothetical protein APR41_05245 [Salegentibacter salinarum]SKB49719.1 hypothetical protein SAMN05660903_01074 [Salegentibacter salinarum]